MIHLLISSIAQNLPVYKSHCQPFLVSQCDLALYRRVGAEGGCRTVSVTTMGAKEEGRQDTKKLSSIYEFFL